MPRGVDGFRASAPHGSVHEACPTGQGADGVGVRDARISDAPPPHAHAGECHRVKGHILWGRMSLCRYGRSKESPRIRSYR